MYIPIHIFAVAPRKLGVMLSRNARLFGPLAVLNLPVLLAVPLAVAGYVPVAIGAAVVSGLALLLALAYRGAGDEIWLALGLMVLHLALGMVCYPEWGALATREIVTGVSVAQAAEYPDAGGFCFTDGWA